MPNENSKGIDLVQLVTDHAQRILRPKVRALIAERLAELDISPPDHVIDELVAQAFSGQSAVVRWGNQEEQERVESIVFTDHDIADLEGSISKLVANLPEAVDKASDQVSKKLLQ